METKKSILIADGNEFVLTYLQLFFSRLGYETILIANGREIKKTVKQKRMSNLCLALVDIHMFPGNFPIKKIIQSRHPQVPIIMMSAMNYPEKNRELLCKPFSREELNNEIRKCIPTWG